MKNNLEERTLSFAIDVRRLISKLPKTIANLSDGKQVVRSSGSIGANYIEANENVGAKDLVFRMKIARKEAKETVYWLEILQATNPNEASLSTLKNEAIELKKILSAILLKLAR